MSVIYMKNQISLVKIIVDYFSKYIAVNDIEIIKLNQNF